MVKLSGGGGGGGGGGENGRSPLPVNVSFTAHGFYIP